jgi:hypothetical protein
LLAALAMSHDRLLMSAEANELMMLECWMTQVEAFALCCGTCFVGIWYPMVYSSGGGDMKGMRGLGLTSL